MREADHRDRVARLRSEMSRRDLAGYLIPHEDGYLNEWTPAADCRLEWLTGFSGSAGIAVVLRDRAAVLTDARYTRQAAQQCAQDLFEVHDLVDLPWQDYVARHAAGGAIGFDPALHSIASLAVLRALSRSASFETVAVPENLVDGIWQDRPAIEVLPAHVHPVRLAGESSASKRTRLAGELGGGCSAAVIATCDNTAWLVNIRGGGLPYLPAPPGRALLHADASVDLFVAPESVDDRTREQLGDDIRIHPPAMFADHLKALAGSRVLVDPATTPVAIETQLHDAGVQVMRGSDPCHLAKAVKNEQEIAGARDVHRRDGAILVQLLHWIDTHGPTGSVDELAVARRYRELHEADERYWGLGFPVAACVGAHSSYPHYAPTSESNVPLEPGEVFLIDAGAQFHDGTTDITRTVPIGAPRPEHVQAHTLALKAHIAHAVLRFPPGIGAMHIDAVARQHFWRAGLDYGPGTAHLIGSFLKVHEGPMYMHWKRGNEVPLLPGMIIEHEPGYYRPDEFGVRVENTFLIGEPAVPPGGELPMCGFEVISLAPVDRRLIDLDALSDEEIRWIDEYHEVVENELRNLLPPEVSSWLHEMTRPLRPAARP
ncbi:M24 family metallopeptidase [Saccharopolyspora shandongensis]|uniref:M24 family metallopeptidase n=1 Tax=Saccharopolyspora shandongensis TaxID=418495 RepID=UPI0033F31F5C